MIIEQTLLQEIEESKRWLNLEREVSTYKRDLAKRIELINRVLENMKNPNTKICELLESKMKESILKINQIQDIFEEDKFNSELRILNWILFQICNTNKKEITY